MQKRGLLYCSHSREMINTKVCQLTMYRCIVSQLQTHPSSLFDAELDPVNISLLSGGAVLGCVSKRCWRYMAGQRVCLFLMCCFVSCLLLERTVASGVQATPQCSLLCKFQSTHVRGFLASFSDVLPSSFPTTQRAASQSVFVAALGNFLCVSSLAS